MTQAADVSTKSAPRRLTSALADLVEKDEIDLPLLPEVASQVITACMDAECDLRKLTMVINRDPSMTAHLLRLANSALYSCAVQINSLQQALNRLGLKKIRELALLASCESRVFRVEGFDLTVRQLFRHSLATAAYAQELSKRLGTSAEEAFLAGLLHDVGRPVLIQAIADLKQELEIEVDREVVEAMCDEAHCQVGARLVESWNLSPRLGETIRYHHDPFSAEKCRQEAMLTRLADDLAHLTLGTDEFTEQQLLEHSLLEPLRVSVRQMEELLSRREAVREAVESMA